MNNRQGGRRRGRNNNNQRSQGGQGRNHDQGNRIDSRARGNAAQLLEKYRNMARDAQLSGDRVMTEYYLQFADHYFRVLSDSRARQEEQRARYEDRDDDREGNSSGDADDGEAEELDAIDSIGRAPRNRERQNNNRGGDRQEFQSARPAQEDGDAGEERRERRPRRERAERSERPERAERSNGHAADRHQDEAPLGIDIAVLPPAIGTDTPRSEEAAATGEEEAAPAPKRRGRPRKVANDGENAAA